MTMQKALLSLVICFLATACGSAKFSGNQKKKSNDVAPAVCKVQAFPQLACMPKNACEAIKKADETCTCELNKDACVITKTPVTDDPSQHDNANQNDDANQSDDDANQGDNNPNQSK